MRRKQTKRQKTSRTKSRRAGQVKHITLLNIALLFVFVGSVFVYLIQIAQSTTKGFEIDEMQKSLAINEEQVRVAEQEINHMKSVEYINQQAVSLKMVKITQTEFLSPLPTSFAFNE